MSTPITVNVPTEFQKKFASLKKTFNDQSNALKRTGYRGIERDQKKIIDDLLSARPKVDLGDLPASDKPLTHVYLAEQLQEASARLAITSLVFRHKISGDDCVGYLALGLENNTELSELDLNANNISPLGAYYLAQGLKNKSQLTSLHLDDNSIGNAGIPFLAEAIAQSKKLALSLRKNLIRDIKPLIEKLDCLESLDLSYNTLGDDGIAELAMALESNTTLRKLNLDSVQMGARGVAALIAMLEKNHTLTELELGNPSDELRNISVPWENSFKQADLEQINTLLERNRKTAVTKTAEPSIQAASRATSPTASRPKPVAFIGGLFLLAGGSVLLGAAALGFFGFFSLGFLFPIILGGAAACSIGVAVVALDCAMRCREKHDASTPASTNRFSYLEAMAELGGNRASNEGDDIKLLSTSMAVPYTPSPLAPLKSRVVRQPELSETPSPVPFMAPKRS